jgi:hypothetical protein
MRLEYWKSFVGLFRSRLASLEVAGRLSNTKLDELFETEVYVSTSKAFLSIWVKAESGEGSYNALSEKNREDCNPWFMSDDGVFEVDGKKLDEEAAVEHFAAKLLN